MKTKQLTTSLFNESDFKSLWWSSRNLLKAIEANIEPNGFIKHQYIADEMESLTEALKLAGKV